MSICRISRLVLVSSLLCLLPIACGDDNGGGSTGPTPTGSLQVTLTIAGDALDADGCVFTVDGASSRRLTAGESTTYTGLAVGQHEVAISDVAGNCQVLGEAIRSVSVTGGQTATVTYAVTCAPTVGAIEVSVTTAGEDLDADGYEVVLDAGVPSAIAINGSMTTGDLTPGDHTLALQGEAFNCDVGGNNPRTVTVTAGAETQVTINVSCRYHLYNRIAYVSVTPSAMMLHSVDPQVPRVVRSLGIEGEHPAVAPDGLRIAYDWNLDIWVANADGSATVNLTDNAQGEEFPAWSPDGTRLVFVRDNILWTMDADGSSQSSLGIPGWAPTWSPDGSQIAFTSAQGVSSNEIWVMNADGSGQPVNVSNHSDWDAHPAWSPLGNLIAFSSTRDGGPDVCAVDPAGGLVVNMTGSIIAAASSPTWAPEAVAGAFQSDAGGNEDILYFEPGSQLPVLLTTSTAQDIQPSWGGGN